MTESTDGLIEGLARIWDKYRPVVMEQVASLEEAAMSQLAGSLGTEERRAAERNAHKLAGSVGTFGFGEASKVAREIEYILGGTDEIGPTDSLRMSELVVMLRDGIEGRDASGTVRTASPEPVAPEAPAIAPPPPAPGSPEAPLCWVISGDEELVGRVRMEAEGRGIVVTAMGSIPPSPLPTSVKKPSVVVVDADGQHEEAMALLDRCTSQDPPIAPVVLASPGMVTDRVSVARHGGRVFLPKPTPPLRIVDAVSGELDRSARRVTRILCVDDDEAILGALEALMVTAGMEAFTLSDPTVFWETLNDVAPDVVVLDVDMPEVSGPELCRVMRNDARWALVPVVFLTARRDEGTIAEVFASGADDFVGKPLVGPELLARIANRLDRIEVVRSLTDTDPLSGVPNRQKALGTLETFVGFAKRHDRTVSVAMLHVDGLKDLNRVAGYGEGDQVLRETGAVLRRLFRSDDVVGRWSGGMFLIGMLGMGRLDGVQRVAEAIEELRRDVAAKVRDVTVGFSAGVAELPADGTDVTTVRSAAESALEAARAAGGDKVRFPGWSPGAEHDRSAVDVAVIEDDEAIGGLLRHALETRGYSSVSFTDGDEAVRALSGATPSVRARVALLDVDLPSLDGLSVLRRLGSDGVLRGTKVIMLTVRAAEIEVLKAMELGAFDHVAKPFSIPVLMQRVRRAMEVTASPGLS
jgi:diguanylate cyclase (GGDEF)-like protein